MFAIGFLLFFTTSELTGFSGSYEDCRLDGHPSQTSLQKQERCKQVCLRPLIQAQAEAGGHVTQGQAGLQSCVPGQLVLWGDQISKQTNKRKQVQI